MRVTADTKQRTRQRIMRSAERLFRTRGFAATSTRDIAAAADIANGTLFNYFPTKDALAEALAAEALDEAAAALEARRRRVKSVEEALFAFVMSGLRKLELHRAWVRHVVDGESVRAAQLERAAGLIAAHGHAASAVALQLFWTLYLGLVTFWSRDESAGQENTLVVLDESMHLFARSLAEARN